LTGIEEGLRGRRQVAMPALWPKVFAAIGADVDPRVRWRATGLGLTFGDPAARASLRRVVTDAQADLAQRQEALAALLKVKEPRLAATLHRLVCDPALGGPAVRGLSAYNDPATPDVLIKSYPSLAASARRDVLSTLAVRKDWARTLVAAVEEGRLPRADLTAELVRQLRNLKDPDLDREIGRVWGTVRETTADRARLIGRYKAMLTAIPSRAPEPSLGRAVFARVCQQCHTLFGVGGQVGPDLTGSNRADLDYVLSNVLDPSALIGRDYLAHVIATTDGRVLTGLIRAEDQGTITLVTANETVTLPKNEVQERRASEQSMMADDLWKLLSEHEIRSLVSYLASPAQVPMPAADAGPQTP
jgi:putative heme-binding domain-containing protein